MREETARGNSRTPESPSFLFGLFRGVAVVWFGLLGFFLGFVVAQGTGLLELRRLGNVPDAPPPAFPQWLAWCLPVLCGLAGAAGGARIAAAVMRRARDVGR
jgi:hypothetical protein